LQTQFCHSDQGGCKALQLQQEINFHVTGRPMRSDIYLLPRLSAHAVGSEEIRRLAGFSLAMLLSLAIWVGIGEAVASIVAGWH
jgi:hypothetical protein